MNNLFCSIQKKNYLFKDSSFKKMEFYKLDEILQTRFSKHKPYSVVFFKYFDRKKKRVFF